MIYTVLQTPSIKKKAFEQLELLEKVAKFKAKFYPRKWAKYEEATKNHIKLVLRIIELKS